MGDIKVKKLDIEGLVLIKARKISKTKGFEYEIINKNDMYAVGLDNVFVQEIQAKYEMGTLKGLRIQPNFPQGLLVRIISGKVFFVAVDLREGSKTYAKWKGIELSDKNKRQFYIDEGFAYGFLVLSQEAEINIKYTNYCVEDDMQGIIWNDTDIGILWPQTDVIDKKIDTKEKKYQTLEVFKKKMIDKKISKNHDIDYLEEIHKFEGNYLIFKNSIKLFSRYLAISNKDYIYNETYLPRFCGAFYSFIKYVKLKYIILLEVGKKFYSCDKKTNDYINITIDNYWMYIYEKGEFNINVREAADIEKILSNTIELRVKKYKLNKEYVHTYKQEIIENGKLKEKEFEDTIDNLVQYIEEVEK